MEEQAEETLSENTLSGEEFDPNDPNQLEEDNEDEWESVSQVSGVSGTSTSMAFSGSSSSVWIYFDKDPAHALGHSVCKKCSKKYKLSTSVSVL